MTKQTEIKMDAAVETAAPTAAKAEQQPTAAAITPEVKPSNDLVIHQEMQQIAPSNLYADKHVFEHAQRVATMFSKSDLVPDHFKNNVGNCVIALEMANRIKASPLMVMQHLYIVHGKPAWSSTFLIATVNACGKFSPLRYDEDDQNGGRTRAWAIDKSNGERVNGTWVSNEMAQAEGWMQKKGSKWQTMPDLMRRYRAATFFARQFAPEVSMGIHTMEEIHDVQYVEIKPEQEHMELVELFKAKKSKLTMGEIMDAERIIDGKETKSYSKLTKYLKSK